MATFLIWNLPLQYVNAFCLILILVFGIPHGAVDHRIHLSTSEDTSVIKYVLKYVLIAGGFILWWLLDPSKALLMFILLSSYHFGQELLEDQEIKNSSLFVRMIWGALILIAPMIYHLEEITPYLVVVVKAEVFDIGSWRFITPSLIILMAIGSLIMLYRQGTGIRKIFRLFIFLMFIVISHVLMPFVLAFTLYFVLFHSLNAFRHQYFWLRREKKHYNLGRFISDLIGFSLLAILGILALLWFVKPENQTILITYFFILISLITLPHAITLDQFYRFRSKPKLRTN